MEQMQKNIENLYNKYKDDEYVLQRLNVYITSYLPSALEKAAELFQERTERKERLAAYGEDFTTRFLSRNHYYYCPRIEQFFKYDKITFKAYSEDDIQHQILSSITCQKDLVPWKHKMKISIMKLIRERSPITAIPESDTIQNVLNELQDGIFPSKNSAKHFLTSIGDCINQNKELVYIIPRSLKEIIREIEHSYYIYFGSSSLLSNFKYKYYGHDYSKSRFLHNTPSKKALKAKNSLSKKMMDLFCVAKYYSDRYKNADGFLEDKKTEQQLYNHAFFIKDKSPEGLVDNFLEKTIHSCQGATIKSKNMIFVWKKFLDELNIPNIIFYDTLNNIFKEKLSYNKETDEYNNVTSTYLPVVASFISFWDENMQEDVTAPEIEIEEIIELFAKSPETKTNTYITDDIVIELLHYIYPDVLIEDNKYICNMSCKLWNKKEEVALFLLECKMSSNHFISLYEGYQEYIKQKNRLINMSKRCFEKISREELVQYVNEHGEIDNNYWGM
jgi:hypothetical protein